MSKKRKLKETDEVNVEKKVCIESIFGNQKALSPGTSTENRHISKDSELMRRKLFDIAKSIISLPSSSATVVNTFIKSVLKYKIIQKFFQFFEEEEHYLTEMELLACFRIVAGFIELNSIELNEKIFANESAKGLFGCLEYDPLDTSNMKHRNFLDKLHFHQPVPLNDPKLERSIQQMKMVMYIFEETLQNVEYNSCRASLKVYLDTEKVQIVMKLFENESFLSTLVETLMDSTENDELQLSVLNLLKELLELIKEFDNLPGKCYYKALIEKKILLGLVVAMDKGRTNSRKLASNLLCKIVRNSTDAVRNYLVEQYIELATKSDDSCLVIKVLMQIMFNARNSDISFSVLEIFELVLDPANVTFETELCRDIYDTTLDFIRDQTFDDEKLKKLKFFGPLEAALKLILFYLENHAELIKQLKHLTTLVPTIIFLILSNSNLLTAEGLQILKMLIVWDDIQVNEVLIKYKILQLMVERFDQEQRDNFVKMKIRNILGLIMRGDNNRLRICLEELYGKRFAEIKLPLRTEKEKNDLNLVESKKPGLAMLRRAIDLDRVAKRSRVRLNYSAN